MLNHRDKTMLKSLLLPGGVVFLVLAVFVSTQWPALSLPALVFAYYASLIVGLLLAWRFHSSRVFFALIVIFLSHQAVAHFSMGGSFSGSGRSALQAVGLLLPLNFLALSLMHERGFTSSAVGTTSLVLFIESVIVFVVGNTEASHPAPRPHHSVTPAAMPAYIWAVFATVLIILLSRYFLFRKPVESALLWSQSAFFLGLHFGGAGRNAAASFAASALILAASIVETSYALAYHDELTSLPSRRAFNDALLRLQAPYSIAVVDIDHFKRFNDTYGHDIGDEVLRLVASKLARVTGGGAAYRCGGEEFMILFPGKIISDVVDHLERLRATIETSSFHMRGNDRRQTPRGPDRRTKRPRVRTQAGRAIRQLAQAPESSDLSVTVSIGVAASGTAESDPDRVIKAADTALYRAKHAGRNRVETATSPRRIRTKTEEIA